jgi:hypothetical protein
LRKTQHTRHGFALQLAHDYHLRDAGILVRCARGIGAETGTPVLAITAAAGTGSKPLGITVLLAFIIGIFFANTLIAWLSTHCFFSAQKRQALYLFVGVVAGTFSIIAGIVFLLNAADILPAL